MIIESSILGQCEVEVCIEASAVDAFIMAGFSLTLDRELTDQELDTLQAEFAGEIQAYAYENGSINHN